MAGKAVGISRRAGDMVPGICNLGAQHFLHQPPEFGRSFEAKRMSKFAAIFALGIPFVVLLGSGCEKKQPAVAVPSSPAYKTLARLHWLGKQRISADTNAAYFLSLWNLPETIRLQNQTLDKLAAKFGAGNAAGTATNAQLQVTNSLLRPLLDDLVEAESVVEIRQAPGEQLEAALAVKLAEDRAQLWRSNLLCLDGVQSLALTSGTNCLGVLAKNGWLCVSAPGSSSLASNLLAAAAEPGASSQAGTNMQTTNYWLEADLDAQWLMQVAGVKFSLPTGWPRVRLTSAGEGEYVRTRAQFDFPKSLDLQLEPWNIPTNLIREPLISLTALQGVQPWLAGLKLVKELQVSPVPNQFFLWALSTASVQTFGAAPLSNAIAQMDRVGAEVEARVNAFLTNVATGKAEFSLTNHGVGWVPVPLLTPVMQALSTPDGEVLCGRLGSIRPPPGKTAPPELLSRITDSTNLVCYDWEITQSRVEHWILLSQSFRLAFKRAQLPPASAAMEWLQAIAPKLGNTVTEVYTAGKSGLRLVRKSHCGLTGFELHLLADWLESPRFPESTYTLLAPPAQMLRWRAKTRSFEPQTNTNSVVSPPK